MPSHLEEEGLSYFAHMRRAITISWLLGKAAVLCGIHAFVPNLFCKSATETIEKLNEIYFK